MTEKKCPHCGKTISLEEEVFGIDAETAFLELILAQMARVYRQQFSLGYPTDGENDLTALTQLFTSYRDEAGRLTIAVITRILDHWRMYLAKAGEAGRITPFVFDWVPDQEPGARIIPFRRRPQD